MESSLGPGPGGEAGRRGPQWALGPAHTWRGGCGQRAHEVWGTCGLLRPGSRVDRAVPWAPCPSHGGARAGSCLSWKLGLAVRLSAALAACGPAGRPTGTRPPPPPAPLRLPARLPSRGHASLCPSRLVSSEEVRCVLVGSSVPGRGWRRSAGVESSAHSPWGRAALPMASGALGLAGGTLHWTRGCRWGPRGLLSDLRNRDRCVFAAHVCPCLTIAITAR